MFIALGLGLVAAGCDKGGGKNETTDNRDKVVGTYPVKVSVPAGDDIYTVLTLAREGDGNLRASASVDMPDADALTIDLVLSELKEYGDEGGQAVTGYYFMIADQELTVMDIPMTLGGTGAYTGGYDGKVYKGEAGAFISLEISDATGMVGIKVETGTYSPPEDNRSKVTGTYPVKVTASVLPARIYASLELAEEGAGNLKASATVEVPTMGAMNLELVLSELKEYGDEGGKAVTGYYFMIADQELDILGTPVTLRGKSSFSGYDGKVYSNGTDAFVSFEIGSEDGTIGIMVETGSMPVHSLDYVAGTYPVVITSGALPNPLRTDLTIAKGENNVLLASATVDGVMIMQFILSGVKEYNQENGSDVIGYYFRILPQDMSIMMMLMSFRGTGAYNGYDGKIYRSETGAFISFQVSDDSGVVRVKVESEQ